MRIQTLEKIEAFTFFSFIIVALIGFSVWIDASTYMYTHSQTPISAKVIKKDTAYLKGTPRGYMNEITYYSGLRTYSTYCESFVFTEVFIEDEDIEIVPQEGSCYRPNIYRRTFDVPKVVPAAVTLLVGAGMLLLLSAWQRHRLRQSIDS